MTSPQPEKPTLTDSKGQKIDLRGVSIRLGRGDDNEVILHSDRCSRYHAIITYRGGVFSIRDLDSRNGTFVNGTRLQPHEEYLLGIKAILKLGNLEYVFEDLGKTKTATSNNGTVAVSNQLLIVNPKTLEVTVQSDGKTNKVRLEGQPWRLFQFLYDHRNEVCSRDSILKFVYQTDNIDNWPNDSALEALIARLRGKLGLRDATEPPRIRTVRGIGYTLEL